MTDDEFTAIMRRSGLPLTPETLAGLRHASVLMERMIERSTRDLPPSAEPALVFHPEQRP